MQTRWLSLILVLTLLVSISGQAYAVTTSDDNLEVTFTDSKLEATVRSALKLQSGEQVTQGKMKTLTVLKANGLGITSLEGLQYAENLYELEVYSNSISDLSPLQQMNNLKYLYLKGNKITDISPLGNLLNLQKLWLRHNNLTNISALANLSKVVLLDLTDTNTTNLAPLQEMTNLKQLFLKENPLDLSSGSHASEVIASLVQKGVSVDVSAGGTEVTGVSIDHNTVSLEAGGWKYLTATVSPKTANQGVSWSSNNQKIVKVNNGKILAISPGTAKIIVKTKDGSKTAYCVVTVTGGAAVTGVSIDHNKMGLKVGEWKYLTATVSPKTANQGVIWSSDKPSVAKVQDGKIIAMAPGTAKITVKTKDGSKTAHCVVTVTAKTTKPDSSEKPKIPVIAVTGVSISHNELRLEPGEFFILDSSVLPSNATNNSLIWTSDTQSVAKVDSSGKISALSPGVAVITLTSKDGGHTAICTITVSASEPTELAFKYTNYTIKAEDNKKLPVIMAPKNAWAELVWVSSNPEVATVDQQGKLTALAPGDTVISVSAGDLNANCTITVVDSHKSGVKYKLGQDKNSLNIPKEILKENKELDISHGKMQIIVPTTAWLEALAQLGLDENASVLVEVEQFTPELPQNLMAVGLAYSFNLYAGEVRISSFAEKLLLTMSYDPDLVLHPEKLAIYWFNTETNNWDKLPSLVDTDNNTVTVLLTHWSSFALLEPVVEPVPQGDRSGWLYVIVTGLGLNAILILVWLFKRK